MLQMFLLSCGYSEQNVSLYTGVGTTIQTIILFASLFIADNLKSIKGIISISRLTPVLTVIVLILVRRVDMSDSLKLGLLLASGVLSSAILGIANILVYKFPLMVLGTDGYGRYLSFAGTVSSILNLALSVLVSVFSDRVSMDLIIDIACIVSLISAVFAAIGNQAIRLNKEQNGADTDASSSASSSESQKISVWETIRHFWYDLLPADVLRGLAAGISGLLLMFASRYSLLNESGSAWYVLITRISSLVGYAFLLWFNRRRHSDGVVILLCCLVTGLMMPLMLLMKVQPLFLVMGFILETFSIIISICVPVAVSKRVPAAHMGVYTAKRQVAMTGGTALSSLIVSAFISGDSAWVLLIIAGIFQILFGIGYFVAIRKRPGLPEE